jgi:hypothetical protein
MHLLFIVICFTHIIKSYTTTRPRTPPCVNNITGTLNPVMENSLYWFIFINQFSQLCTILIRWLVLDKAPVSIGVLSFAPYPGVYNCRYAGFPACTSTNSNVYALFIKITCA